MTIDRQALAQELRERTLSSGFSLAGIALGEAWCGLTVVFASTGSLSGVLAGLAGVGSTSSGTSVLIHDHYELVSVAGLRGALRGAVLPGALLIEDNPKLASLAGIVSISSAAAP